MVVVVVVPVVVVVVPCRGVSISNNIVLEGSGSVSGSGWRWL